MKLHRISMWFVFFAPIAALVTGCSGGKSGGGGFSSSTAAATSATGSTTPGSTTPGSTKPGQVATGSGPAVGTVTPPVVTPKPPKPPVVTPPAPPPVVVTPPAPPAPPPPKPPTPPAPPAPPPPPAPTVVKKPAVVTNWTNNKSSRGGTKIDSIVIHTTEGTYAGAISWFKNPSSSASAHYVIKEDGAQITQMVPDNEKAWTQTYYNSRGIGIECAGYSSKAGTWSPGMKKALYDLVAWLAKTYNVKVVHPAGNAYNYPGNSFNGSGLVAHGQIQPWNRSDPGPHFDWNALVKEVNARIGGSSSASPAPAPAPAPSTTGSYPTIKQGSSGQAVTTAQTLLQKKGYSPGAIDGVFGPKTHAATLAFQKAKGLTVDGIIGPKTWAELTK